MDLATNRFFPFKKKSICGWFYFAYSAFKVGQTKSPLQKQHWHKPQVYFVHVFVAATCHKGHIEDSALIA